MYGDSILPHLVIVRHGGLVLRGYGRLYYHEERRTPSVSGKGTFRHHAQLDDGQAKALGLEFDPAGASLAISVVRHQSEPAYFPCDGHGHKSDRRDDSGGGDGRPIRAR